MYVKTRSLADLLAVREDKQVSQSLLSLLVDEQLANKYMLLVGVSPHTIHLGKKGSKDTGGPRCVALGPRRSFSFRSF